MGSPKSSPEIIRRRAADSSSSSASHLRSTFFSKEATFPKPAEPDKSFLKNAETKELLALAAATLVKPSSLYRNEVIDSLFKAGYKAGRCSEYFSSLNKEQKEIFKSIRQAAIQQAYNLYPTSQPLTIDQMQSYTENVINLGCDLLSYVYKFGPTYNKAAPIVPEPIIESMSSAIAPVRISS